MKMYKKKKKIVVILQVRRKIKRIKMTSRTIGREIFANFQKFAIVVAYGHN